MFKYNVFITALLAAALASCAPNRSTYAEVKATDGASCSVYAIEGGSRITCPDGSTTLVRNGTNGSNGTNGTNGQNGQSCTVSVSGLVSCGSSSSFQLPNGLGISSYIYPCGQEFPNDEIFLRMSDGNILALYDGGPNEDRLVLLAPGNYITTDRNKNMTCTFTVTSDLRIINQVVRNPNAGGN